jgi:Protein of unknown function (DUF3768)
MAATGGHANLGGVALRLARLPGAFVRLPADPRHSPAFARRVHRLDAWSVVVTAGFKSLSAGRRHSILARIRAFGNFDEDNDPHCEHDFGLIEEGDVRCFWRIDYHDTDMELMSPDPADPSVTTRVLRVMLAEEY